MAGFDGSIRIDTLLNTRGFERGARGLLSGVERLGNSIRGIMGSLGFAIGIAGFVALGKQAIDTASDIQEVQNVVDTAFGSMAYKMEEFAKTSVKQFGISQLSAKQLGSTFMAMGASMLDSAETASNMAINLTARAADMASFYNKSIEETSYALKSIYTGETESLKEYGVVMTQVNIEEFARQQGINKSIQAMTQSEKVMLNYQYVMQQTSLAAGDFAKTSDSWANQTRILSEQFKELLSVIGSGLITVLTPVVKFLNTVLSMLIAIAKQIGAILSKLFGISIPVADSGQLASDLSAAAGGADDLANGMDAAGSAAKKAGKEASKALAPFDKLNVLKQDSGGSGGAGSGGGAGGAGGGFEMPELSFGEEADGADALGSALDGVIKRLKELKELFVKGFFEGLGDYKPILEELKKDIISIGQTLKEIFTDPEVIAAANRFADQLAYSLGQVVGSMARIGLTIAQLLVGGIEKYLTQNKDRIKQYIISILDIGTEIAAITGNFSVAVADIFSVFGGDTAQQIAANLIGVFAEVGMLISENAANLGRDILNMITKPIIDNKDKIKEAIEGTLEAIEPFTSGLLTAVQKVRDAVSDVYDKYLKPLFDSIANGISEILGKLLDGYNTYIVPVLQGLGERFKEIMEGPFGETIKKISELVGSLIDILRIFWETILVPLFSWISSIAMGTLGKILDILGSGILIAIESVINFVGKISDVVKKFFDFLIENKWIIEAIGAALIGMFAAGKIVPLITTIIGAVQGFIAILSGGGLVSIITGIVGAVQGFIATLVGGGGLGAALSAIVATLGGPVTIAVGAAIAVGALLIANWDKIKEAAGKLKDWIAKKWKEILKVISGAWEGIQKALSNVSTWFKEKFDKAKENIYKAFEGIGEWFGKRYTDVQNAFKDVGNWFKKQFDDAVKNAHLAFETIGSWFGDRWSDITTALSEVASWFKEKFDRAKENVHTAFKAIGSWFESRYEDIQNAFKNVNTWFKDKFERAYSNAKNAFSGAKAAFKIIWGNITSAFGDIAGWFRGKFSDAWKEVESAFSNAKEFMINVGKNIVNGIIDGIKSIWSSLIGMANDIKELFNIKPNVSGAAVSVAGGAFGGIGKAAPYASQPATYSPAVASISDMQIPALASGAVIRGGNPFLAVLGEQRFGQTNVEAPLSTIEKAVSNAMKKNGGMGGDISVRVFLGEKDITKAVKTEADTYFKKTGKNLFLH
jgi:gas vesicle protein